MARDIINALKCLNPNGKIVVHDCLPLSEQSQTVPKQTIHWNGDVWKTIPELKKQNINFRTIDTDEGCCVIDYFEQAETLIPIEDWEFQWMDFVEKRNELMNVITIEEFKNK